MSFKDRSKAGKKPAKALKRYERQNAVILALPRGGVPRRRGSGGRAACAARRRHRAQNGVPWWPELAMGAVVDSSVPVIVRNEDVIELAGLTKPNSNTSAIWGSRKSNASTGAISAIAPCRQGPRHDRHRRWNCHRRDDPNGLARHTCARAEDAHTCGSRRVD